MARCTWFDTRKGSRIATSLGLLRAAEAERAALFFAVVLMMRGGSARLLFPGGCAPMIWIARRGSFCVERMRMPPVPLFFSGGVSGVPRLRRSRSAALDDAKLGRLRLRRRLVG